ncbi:sigma-70 family RNA polymerase sigma factor [Patescibacteria group bacterium]|nr:sigma-70 family RNA polymerase sigma factor [Patescibacteria group bacterium]MBP9709421.1 sigma-70 family RNA polymerase sigma factor [Patescibacteria group bacterium]
MPYPDSSLVAASLNGDVQAFARLYETYANRIYRYHYYRTFHAETAEDLTSQTFMQALEHLPRYDEDKGTFSAWLYTIARNLLIDHIRIHRRQVDIEDGWDLLQDTRSSGKTIEQRDLLERIEKHLHTLSPEQREILILRFWDERPYAEIATILHKSEAACKMSASRALTELRKHAPLALILLMLIPFSPTYVFPSS